jgi:IS5 family transposase
LRLHLQLSGQTRGVFGVIKRELRRRFAVETVIGDMKAAPSACYLENRERDVPPVLSC